MKQQPTQTIENSIHVNDFKYEKQNHLYYSSLDRSIEFKNIENNKTLQHDNGNIRLYMTTQNSKQDDDSVFYS